MASAIAEVKGDLFSLNACPELTPTVLNIHFVNLRNVGHNTPIRAVMQIIFGVTTPRGGDRAFPRWMRYKFRSETKVRQGLQGLRCTSRAQESLYATLILANNSVRGVRRNLGRGVSINSS